MVILWETLWLLWRRRWKVKNRFSCWSAVDVGLCYSPVWERGMLLLLDSEKTLLWPSASVILPFRQPCSTNNRGGHTARKVLELVHNPLACYFSDRVQRPMVQNSKKRNINLESESWPNRVREPEKIWVIVGQYIWPNDADTHPLPTPPPITPDILSATS